VTAPTTTRFEPPVGPGAETFWNATREQRLVLPWCLDCERPFFYPRAICPRCLGSAIGHRESGGTGTVYAVTVEHRPQNPMMAAMAPYAVALVELGEGVRMLSNVVGCPAADVTVGMPVLVTWVPLTDGRHLPCFQPAERDAR
jgi:uncharacterized OB-fold protein